MPKVVYISAAGHAEDVDLPVGWSLMEGAVKNGIAGVLGDCGGAAACATCHIYVDKDWIGLLMEAGPDEAAMLEFAYDRRPESRLSCQVTMEDRLDGIIVHLPEHQIS